MELTPVGVTGFKMTLFADTKPSFFSLSISLFIPQTDEVLHKRYSNHLGSSGPYGLYLECSDADADKVDPRHVRDCVAPTLQGRDYNDAPQQLDLVHANQ